MQLKHAIVIAALTAFAVPVLALSAADSSSSPPIKMQNGIDREPPAPIYEVEPPARPGYVWAPGCWTQSRGRLVWEPGSWIAEREDQTWVPCGWEKRADKWYYAKGYWEPNESADEEETVTEEVAEPTPPNQKSRTKTTKKHTVKKKADYSNQKIWPGFQRN